MGLEYFFCDNVIEAVHFSTSSSIWNVIVILLTKQMFKIIVTVGVVRYIVFIFFMRIENIW